MSFSKDNFCYILMKFYFPWEKKTKQNIISQTIEKRMWFRTGRAQRGAKWGSKYTSNGYKFNHHFTEQT